MAGLPDLCLLGYFSIAMWIRERVREGGGDVVERKCELPSECLSPFFAPPPCRQKWRLHKPRILESEMSACICALSEDRNGQ